MPAKSQTELSTTSSFFRVSDWERQTIGQQSAAKKVTVPKSERPM